MHNGINAIALQLEEINKTLKGILEKLQGEVGVRVSSDEPLNVFVSTGLGEPLDVNISNTVDISQADD
jgi:hypothetical protein